LINHVRKSSSAKRGRSLNVGRTKKRAKFWRSLFRKKKKPHLETNFLESVSRPHPESKAKIFSEERGTQTEEARGEKDPSSSCKPLKVGTNSHPQAYTGSTRTAPLGRIKDSIKEERDPWGGKERENGVRGLEESKPQEVLIVQTQRNMKTKDYQVSGGEGSSSRVSETKGKPRRQTQNGSFEKCKKKSQT